MTFLIQSLMCISYLCKNLFLSPSLWPRYHGYLVPASSMCAQIYVKFKYSTFKKPNISLMFRCVMKMDHHCPWINNCVGHRNHGSFTLFLFFAPIGCIHALCILIPAMYRAINRVSIEIDIFVYMFVCINLKKY